MGNIAYHTIFPLQFQAIPPSGACPGQSGTRARPIGELSLGGTALGWYWPNIQVARVYLIPGSGEFCPCPDGFLPYGKRLFTIGQKLLSQPENSPRRGLLRFPWRERRQQTLPLRQCNLNHKEAKVKIAGIGHILSHIRQRHATELGHQPPQPHFT